MKNISALTLFFAISVYSIAQSGKAPAHAIYLETDLEKAGNKNAEDFIVSRIKKGELRGTLLSCMQRYEWAAVSADDTLAKPKVVAGKVNEEDMNRYAKYQMKYGKRRGSIEFCNIVTKWKGSGSDFKYKLVVYRKKGSEENVTASARNKPITSFVQLEKIVPLDIPIDFDNEEQFGTATWQNELWAITSLPKETSSALGLTRVNLDSYKLDTLVIKLPQQYVDEMIDAIRLALAVNDSFIVIGNDQKLFIYDRKKQNTLLRVASIETEIEHLRLSGSRLLVSYCYSYTPATGKPSAVLAIYDIPDDKITRKVAPGFDLPEYAQFYPHHWIDATDKRILFSQVLSYKIQVYNYALDKVATIDYKKPGWRAIDPAIIDSIKLLRGKDGYSQYIRETVFPEKRKINTVISARFMNDSIIMVCISPSKAEQDSITDLVYLYDIWQLKNGQFTLTHTDLTDSYPPDDLECSYDNYPLNASYGIFTDYHFSNNKIAGIKVDGEIMPLGHKYGKLKKELQKKFDGWNIGGNIYIYNVQPSIHSTVNGQ